MQTHTTTPQSHLPIWRPFQSQQCIWDVITGVKDLFTWAMIQHDITNNWNSLQASLLYLANHDIPLVCEKWQYIPQALIDLVESWNYPIPLGETYITRKEAQQIVAHIIRWDLEAHQHMQVLEMIICLHKTVKNIEEEMVQITGISDLFQWIDKLPTWWLQWELKFYTRRELKDMIRWVRQEPKNIKFVPRARGLRKIMIGLLCWEYNDNIT